MLKIADKEELLKVLHENGNETGNYENRSLVHSNRLFHNEIALWIIDKENKKVLVQRRSAYKKQNPNKLALCAGHVVANETIEEALFKEAKEEIGINLNKFKVNKLTTIKRIEPQNYCFSHHYYIMSNIPQEDFTIQEEELSEVFYIDYEQLKNLIKINNEDVAIKWNTEIERVFILLDEVIYE